MRIGGAKSARPSLTSGKRKDAPFSQEKAVGTFVPTAFVFLTLFGFFRAHDFPAVIIAALRADLMGLLQLMAMRALYERRSRRFEVRISCIRSLFGLFGLGYCHLRSPLLSVLPADLQIIPYSKSFVNLFLC